MTMTATLINVAAPMGMHPAYMLTVGLRHRDDHLSG